MTRRWLVAAGVALLLVSATVPATAAHPDPALVVDLDEDGSAQVTLRLTYDLTTDAERSAFEELRASESTRRATLDRFRERMSRVANASENATGRSMSVAAGGVDLTTTDDDVGVVRLSVDWEGLAATPAGRVVLTTPFSDGYDPDRRLVVAGPEGYAVADVSPSPTASDDGRLRWDPGASLDGFSVTYSPADGDEGTATEAGGTDAGTVTGGDGEGGASGGSAPGFGGAAALTALLAAAVALVRRR